MSHAELVLLSLLTEESVHAYGLVQRIRSMEVERWATVAESTLYSVLRRMEERGFVETRSVPGDRGRPRTEYQLTASGRRRLAELVREGLDDPAPVRSDRLVAAVVAAPAGEADRLRVAENALRRRRAALASARDREGLSARGGIILDFYAALAEAHLEALAGLRRLADGAPEQAVPEVPADTSSG